MENGPWGYHSFTDLQVLHEARTGERRGLVAMSGGGRRAALGRHERVDADEEARDRLLNAAERCFERLGLRRTTIDDIAQEAKVSRSTVYRYFDGRGDLLVSAYLRESVATNERLRAMLDGPGLVRRVASWRPPCERSTPSDPGEYLPLDVVAGRSAPGVQGDHRVGRVLRHDARDDGTVPAMPRRKPARCRADLELDDYNEWMMRLVFSFAMVAGPTEADRIARPEAPRGVPRALAACRRRPSADSALGGRERQRERLHAVEHEAPLERTAAGSTASRISRQRSRSRPTATAASARARFAPRQ